jgi:hypothetical protein
MTQSTRVLWRVAWHKTMSRSQAADTIKAESGVDIVADYDHQAYYQPQIGVCAWAGVGSVGGGWTTQQSSSAGVRDMPHISTPRCGTVFSSLFPIWVEGASFTRNTNKNLNTCRRSQPHFHHCNDCSLVYSCVHLAIHRALEISWVSFVFYK